MAGTLPPLFEITDDDHGGYIAVVSYTLLILMIGLVATRIFTRWYIVRSIKVDDYFLFATAILGILQSIFVQFALNEGLGRKRDTVSDSGFELYQKYEYVTQILFIATVASAKVSLTFLVQSLLGEGYSLLAGKCLLLVIVAWAVSSILALALQCSLPKPWDNSGLCINQRALHFSISILNIVTDALLVLLPCFVIWKVHLSTKRRNRILALFATRIAVCIVTGVELHYYELMHASMDKTWSNLDSSIWTQIILNFSIIFTAIPSLGRLIVELQPAVNAFAITEQHGLRSRDRYALSSLAGPFPHEFATTERLDLQARVFESLARRGSGSRRASKVSRGVIDVGNVKCLREEDVEYGEPGQIFALGTY